MNFKKLFFLITLMLSSASVLSHEGHDSATAKSLHGGVVKKTKNAFVEVLYDEVVEIYVSGHDYKSIVGPKLNIKAEADIKGKKIPLKLEMKKNNYVIMTDLSKEKHFKLNIILKNDNKDETASFPLEKN